MRRWSGLAVVTGLLAGAGQAAAPSAFGPGEQIDYQVRYLGLEAGTARLTVGWPLEQEGRAVWPLVCVGQTSRLTAAFPVKDRFVSYWDPAAGEPVGADFFADENRHRRREAYRYDRAAGKAYARKQREGQPVQERSYEIAPGTADLAAAAFALRNRDLSVGAEHQLPIFTGDRTFTLRARVEARERVDTGLGPRDAWRVSVQVEFSGKLQTRRNLTLWFTADARQVPVRAEADFLLGAVVLDAVSYAPGRAPGDLP